MSYIVAVVHFVVGSNIPTVIIERTNSRQAAEALEKFLGDAFSDDDNVESEIIEDRL